MRLTDTLNVYLARNNEETSIDGEKHEYHISEDNYVDNYYRIKNDMNKRDILISDIKMENERYCMKIKSLQREIEILRDCNKKNLILENKRNKSLKLKTNENKNWNKRFCKLMKIISLFLVMIIVIIIGSIVYYDKNLETLIWSRLDEYIQDGECEKDIYYGKIFKQ